MKKIVITFIIVLLLTGGCKFFMGSEVEPTPVPEVTNTPTAVSTPTVTPTPTITPTPTATPLVTLDVFMYTEAGSPDEQSWEAIKNAFQTANPEIGLSVSTNYGDAYHQLLASGIASGNTPDVMFLWPGARSGYVYEYNVVEDLTSRIESNTTISGADYVEAALYPQWGAAVHVLPLAVTSTHLFYVNNKILTDLGLSTPRTYAELKAMVPTLTDNNYTSIIMPNQSDWVMNSCLMSAILGRYGGRNWIEGAIAGTNSFNDQVFIDSLTMLKTMYDDGVLPQDTLDLAYGASPGQFGFLESPFMIDGDWRVGAVIPIFSETQQQDDIELTIFPALPNEVYGNSTSMLAAPGLGMKAGLTGLKADAAWKLVQFFAGEEAARIRLFGEGIFPAYKLNIADYQASLQPLAMKRWQLYREHKGSAVIDNYLPVNPNIVLNDGMRAIGNGTKTPAQVASEVETAMAAER